MKIRTKYAIRVPSRAALEIRAQVASGGDGLPGRFLLATHLP